jgi:exopolyphosphatase/guanosine-5'-triphosphate,3'-diphosphate pyrophosphatase
MILAAIDMGTNTIRLLLAQKTEGCRFKVLYQESRIARIGEGFGKSRIITDAALTRTLNILNDYKKIIVNLKAENIVIVATSAIREAKNKESFVKLIKENTGFEINIISAQKEAYLTQLGIIYNIEDIISQKEWMAFDLGGGSTEFIFSQGKNFIDSFSIPYGVVKLLEMFVENDPPSAIELNNIRKFFLAELEKRYKHNRNIDLVVGNAGTVTSLSAIDLKLIDYSYEKVEGYRLNSQSIDRILKRLLTLTKAERLKEFNILEKGREDVIVVGAVVVKSILEFFSKNYLIATNGSLREGLLIERFCK